MLSDLIFEYFRNDKTVNEPDRLSIAFTNG